LKRGRDPRQLSAYCARPTPERPLSGLAALIAASIARNLDTTGPGESGEWTVLRKLYRVN
jgi:hypothetical protein